MFSKKKQPPIKSLIAKGSQIDGHLRFDAGLRVDGDIIGNVSADDTHPSILVISETAYIRGEARADHIVINGTVHGPVHARELLELQPKAKIQGDVHYKALEMHQGASIAGMLCPMGGDEEEKPALKLASSSP